MARIIVERPHSLGLEAARARAENLAERLAGKFEVRYHWVGNSLELTRSGADGKVDVHDDRVRVELKLGLLLSTMSSNIQREIEKSLDKYLV